MKFFDQLKVIDLFLKNHADPNLRTEKGVPYLVKAHKLPWFLLKKLILAGLDITYLWTDEQNKTYQKSLLDVFHTNNDNNDIALHYIFYGGKTKNEKLIEKYKVFFNIRANAEKLYEKHLERKKELYHTLDALNFPTVLSDLIVEYENLQLTIFELCTDLNRELFKQEIEKVTVKDDDVSTILVEEECMDESGSPLCCCCVVS